MFNRFSSNFVPDDQVDAVGEGSGVPSADQAVPEFFTRFGGASFNDGLYRIFKFSDVKDWNEKIGAAFPAFKEKVTCFAVDWLGRVFALDSQRQVNGRPGVTIFEPGTGQALLTPCDIETLHEDELVNHRDAALAEGFFKQWIQSGGGSPSFNRCVGYKRPLFLGGADTVENLELTDLDVYWTISAQLISRLRNVPAGTGVKVTGG